MAISSCGSAISPGAAVKAALLNKLRAWALFFGCGCFDSLYGGNPGHHLLPREG
jgi:hypothetical protein